MSGRYKILEQLGAGGVGAVFKAYDTQLNRYVAIKRLLTKDEVDTHTDRTDTLIKEAGSLAALQHPNIVSVYDLANDEEGFFIVMELLEGDTLANWIYSGSLSLQDFYELATQTLEAVLTAHHQSILHRDLKPENIKVVRLPGGRIQVKVLDFGLARLSYGARKMTEDQSGNIFGSIHYMAPEQLQRQPIDTRADLYSLGCVFYQTLSGYRPFEHEDIQTVIQLHLQHRVHPLNHVATHVPQPISDWVMWLMNLDPATRPASAQQALDTLREIHKAGWFRISEPVPNAIPVAIPVATAVPSPTTSQRLVRPGTQRLAAQPSAQLNRRPSGNVPAPRNPSSTVKPPQKKTKPDDEEPTKLPIWIWPAGIAAIAAVAWSLWPKSEGKPAPTSPPAQTSSAATPTQPTSPATPEIPTLASPIANRPPDLVFSDNILQLRAGSHMIAPGNLAVQTDNPVEKWSDSGKNASDATRNLIAKQAPTYHFDKPDTLNNPIGYLRFQPGQHMLHRMAKDQPAYKNYPMATSTRRPGVTVTLVARPNPDSDEIQLLQLSDQDNKASLTLKVSANGDIHAISQVNQDRKQATASGPKPQTFSIITAVWNAGTNKLDLIIRNQDSNKSTASSDTPAKAPILNEIRLPGTQANANLKGDIAELIVWPYAMEPGQANIQSWRLAQHYFNNPGSRN